ncbi:MAG TPA: DUF1569 domain-containing protein [Sphingobacteriaceae bacterium]
MKNLFSKQDTEEILDRLNSLTPQSPRLWGKMTVSQMLAHCNVTYEMVYDNCHPRPNPLMRLILRLLVRNKVVSETPYKPNGPTAPAFLVKDDKDFETEKARLAGYIRRTQELGADHFEQKESLSFGKLSKDEWNNMFYKHLDHHFRQFGV